MKPEISLYMGQKIVAITKGDEDWQWGIKLDSGVEFRNKDERETVIPMHLVGCTIQAVSMSVRDTTIHLVSEIQTIVHWSFNPTKYVIADPVHGGEVFPQWPELLEEMGIPAIEGGELSAEPSEEWPDEEARLRAEGEARIQDEAAEFLAEEGS